MTDLDRATYFELKVKGTNETEIMSMYEITGIQLRKLRSRWGFTGINTQGFQRMMCEAKKGQAHISKTKKGDDHNDNNYSGTIQETTER